MDRRTFLLAAPLVTGAMKGANDRIAAAFIGVAHFVLSWLVAWGTGEGLASILPLGDRIVFALILTASLVVGMRFAFLSLRNA